MDSSGLFHVERRRSGFSLGWHRNYAAKSIRGSRGEISAFSAASRRRLSRYIGNCDATYLYLGTLTVRAWSPDGSVFKRHLDRYLVWFMRAQKRAAERRRPGLGASKRSSVLWWLEFQTRGAPHVHFLYTERIRWQEAAAAWARAIGDPSVKSTATRFEKIKDPQAMPAYIGKYAAKWEQKSVPSEYHRVGRFWGIRGYRLMRVATLVAEQGAIQREIERAVVKALSEEQNAGRCAIIPWKFGDGFSVYPEKGSGDLERSGLIARVENTLEQITQGGVNVILFEHYQCLEVSGALDLPTLPAKKGAP